MEKFKLISLVFWILLLQTSCEKDFEDLNTNPFQPTQTEIGPLFNSVMESLTLGWNEQLYLHNEVLYKITQQAALTSPTFQNVSIGTEEVWSRFYGALANIRDIEQRIENFEGNPETLTNVKAMLKTILAYKTFRVTDLFGDMPFFNAGKGFEDLAYLRPAFDRQEDIYKFLMEELQWVNDNANILPSPVAEDGTPYLNLIAFDPLFRGDMEQWVKFANSLRLRHAVRMYDKDAGYAGEVINEIISQDVPLIETGEDVAIRPRQIDWKNLSVHWSFREHKKLRLGSNLWNLMSTNDSIDGSGIFDKRMRVFFETNNNNEWAPFPQISNSYTPNSGGAPYSGLRDSNHGVKGVSCIYAPLNYYLIRDEDDVPELIFTAAEVSFLKAEVYYRGLGIGAEENTAKSNYKSGVTKSIRFWNALAGNTAIWVNNIPTLGTNEEFMIYTHPKINWDDQENKLNSIYAQRWIDAFRQPWEAYSLGRRTGNTPREGNLEQHYRFSYPPSEINNNPENWAIQSGEMGGDDVQTKVWWMN